MVYKMQMEKDREERREESKIPRSLYTWSNVAIFNILQRKFKELQMHVEANNW